MTRPTTTAIAFVLAAAAADCTTYPAEPASPTFANDVQPIFMAHCVRCHGANDMLANETLDGVVASGRPLSCYLDRLENRGDCSPVDGGPPDRLLCKLGAGACAVRDASGTSLIDAYLFNFSQDSGGMPPLPAAPLNAWEKNVVRRWLDSGAP